MQVSELLRDTAAYNIWANKTMAAWLENQPNSLFDAVVENSFPSLKKTVFHIYGAEFLWHRRLLGDSPKIFPSPDSVHSAAEVFAKLLESSNDLAALLADKNEDWFDANFDYKNLAGSAFSSVRRDTLQHVFNHSTYHRGQLVTMGRQLGIPNPPSTDFIFYTRER